MTSHSRSVTRISKEQWNAARQHSEQVSMTLQYQDDQLRALWKAFGRLAAFAIAMAVANLTFLILVIVGVI
jgi:hypothetical protein